MRNTKFGILLSVLLASSALLVTPAGALASVLPMSNGGTGVGSFTAGSVLFSNGNSFSQNNANFFWNNTNNRLGIGTNSPTSTLDVNGDLNVSGNIINSQLLPSPGSQERLDFANHTLTLGIDLNGYGRIQGANAADNGQDGGSLDITAGAGSNSYRGGDVGINGGGGRSPDSAGGSVYLKGGEGGPNGNSDGGNVYFYSGFKYGSGAWGKFKFLNYGQTSTYGILDFTTLTGADKTFSFPDTSGTVGIREADQTWTGLNKFEGSSNSTIYLGSTTSPGCIVMGDTSGGAVTYVTANAGVLSASTTKPSTCQ